MLDPLRFSDPLVRVYEACVDELLVNLAKHFNTSAMGNTGSYNYEVMMLSKLGAVHKETAAIIARMVKDNEPMIEEAVRASMLDALEEVEPELKQAATEGLLNDAPMEMMDGIQHQLEAYSKQARSQLNLVNSNMLQGTLDAFRKGVYQANDIITPATIDAAQEALNIETGKVITGVSTLQKATRTAIRSMAANGITGFVDRKGRQWTAEAYVRMCIKTTCANAANQAVMTRNEQYGNDIVWPRVNATSRPGCYPWQGQLISMENRARDVVDGNGKTRHVYAASETTYGQPAGIWGINCHHGPMNVFIPGLSYVRGEDNAPPKAENDRLYELTQEQRRLEREVRYAKRDAAMYDAAGDREAFEKSALKVKAANAKLKSFVNSHDTLVLHSDRTWVSGYNKNVAGRVRTANVRTAAAKTAKTSKISQKQSNNAAPASSLTMFEKLKGAAVRDKAYEAQLAKIFDEGGATAKQVFRKFIPPNGGAVVDGENAADFQRNGSVYMSYQRDANNPRGNGVTFFHEHGHLVDFKNNYISSSRTKFLDALKMDYKNKLKATGFSKVAQQRAALTQELCALPDISNGISDIFDGLSGGKASGFWGHSASYWKNDPTKVPKEAFAHMFVALFDRQREQFMIQYFPNAWAEFKQIMEDIK